MMHSFVRRSDRLMVLMSTPSIRILPAVGSTSRNRAAARDDFPGHRKWTFHYHTTTTPEKHLTSIHPLLGIQVQVVHLVLNVPKVYDIIFIILLAEGGVSQQYSST